MQPVNKSYRIDKTYIRVKGEDKYLCRALDYHPSLLTAKQDTAAAKRSLRRAIDASGNAMPRVMNADKNSACPAAVAELQTEGAIPRRDVLRQCQYLNNDPGIPRPLWPQWLRLAKQLSTRIAIRSTV